MTKNWTEEKPGPLRIVLRTGIVVRLFGLPFLLALMAAMFGLPGVALTFLRNTVVVNGGAARVEDHRGFLVYRRVRRFQAADFKTVRSSHGHTDHHNSRESWRDHRVDMYVVSLPGRDRPKPTVAVVGTPGEADEIAARLSKLLSFPLSGPRHAERVGAPSRAEPQRNIVQRYAYCSAVT